MSFGKLYGYEGNPRTTGLRIIAKENNLDVELVHTAPHEGVPPEYASLNKLGKIPTFVGADGLVLTELIAIAVYFTSQNEKTPLLGKSKQDYASILRWISYANTEVLPTMGGWFRPLIGRDPYNKRNVDTAVEQTAKVMRVLEDHFLLNTYLVGERISLADIITYSIAARGFQTVLDAEWRKSYPAVTRWFETIANQSMVKGVAGEPKLIAEAVKYVPPPKEKAAAKEKPAPKEAPKPKAKPVEEADEEDEPKEAPKPKHPLEELGRPTFALDDWKRKYKNEETREVALPWFWENMNFDEYSIWQIDYKYNDELTLTFMSSNLITGFFNRLEASRKYLMGCQSVYGESNASVVRGAFVVRGQDYKAAFDVAPDWESYDFKKLDPKAAADKDVVESMWAWDKPVTIDGKDYPHADGKIFV